MKICQLLLRYCVVVVCLVSWQPIDEQVVKWDDVPPLNAVPNDVVSDTEDQTKYQWALLPHRWPYKQVQLSYCLTRSEKHQVLLVLVQTAFDEWNQFLPHDTLFGLNLTFAGYCADPVTTT